MERIVQIVCSLILLLLLYSLLELMLPGGNISRFVRLVMGLALLAVAVAPLSRGWELTDAEELLPAMSSFREQGAEQAARGQEIERQLTVAARQEQEAQLSSQLAALAELVSGVEQARARVDLDENGAPVQITLYLQSINPEQAARDVKDLICGFYSVEESRVECRPLEGYHE